eukprot:8472203-Pyramimonas_sp.AAC.1
METAGEGALWSRLAALSSGSSRAFLGLPGGLPGALLFRFGSLWGRVRAQFGLSGAFGGRPGGLG